MSPKPQAAPKPQELCFCGRPARHTGWHRGVPKAKPAADGGLSPKLARKVNMRRLTEEIRLAVAAKERELEAAEAARREAIVRVEEVQGELQALRDCLRGLRHGDAPTPPSAPEAAPSAPPAPEVRPRAVPALEAPSRLPAVPEDQGVRLVRGIFALLPQGPALLATLLAKARKDGFEGGSSELVKHLRRAAASGVCREVRPGAWSATP